MERDSVSKCQSRNMISSLEFYLRGSVLGSADLFAQPEALPAGAFPTLAVEELAQDELLF